MERGRIAFYILALILLTGGLLRVAYWRWAVREPDFWSPAVDAAYHDYWARALATGDWTPPAGQCDPRIRSTAFLRPPGYAYFLAVFYRLFACNSAVARLCQAALGLLGCALVFGLGARWFGEPAGLLAAALSSTYWLLIYYEAELVEVSLFTFLCVMLVWSAADWLGGAGWGRGAATGLLLGLAALVKPNVLAFAPFLLGWWAWMSAQTRLAWRAALRPGLALIAGCAAVIAPITARNALVGREFVLISANGGINLLVGNNPDADGTFESPASFGQFASCFDYPPLVRRLGALLGRRVGYGEASRIFSEMAWEYARANPARSLRLLARKALLLLGPAEIPHNKAEAEVRRHSPVLSALPIGFPAMLSLGIIGFAVAFRERRRRCSSQDAGPDKPTAVMSLIGLFLLSQFMSYLPFFAAVQYRAPLVPLLSIPAAVGLDAWWRMVRRAEFRRAGWWALCWAAIFAVASTPFAGKTPCKARWRFDRGSAFERLGAFSEARAEYLAALAENPAEWRAHVNIGNIYYMEGRPDVAAGRYARALELKPDATGVRSNLAKALAAVGDLTNACQQFSAAAQMAPEDALIVGNAVLFLAACPDPRLRDPARAARLALQALEQGVALDRQVVEQVAVAAEQAGLATESARLREISFGLPRVSLDVE